MQARGLHHKLPRLLVVVHASRVHVSERASAELREGILNHHRDTEGTENSQKKPLCRTLCSLWLRGSGRVVEPIPLLRLPIWAKDKFSAAGTMTSTMADYSHENPLVPADAVRRWVDQLPQPVAVTGGTGFIGSHLVDTLCAAGIEPRVLVRDPAAPRWIGGAPVHWVEGSLADEAALDRLVENAGTVFHLAGVVRAVDEAGFDRGNRVGTEALARCVGRVAPLARLVVVSSLAAAGPSPTAEGVGPDDPAAPISSYGRSKLEAERAVTASRSGGWWAVVRPPAVYGPRDTDVFEFFKMASRGMVVLPAGERWVTVAWVGDVVRSVLAAAVGHGERIYHIGEPSPLTMDGLVATLCGSGRVKARLVRLPEAVVRGVGLLGSAMQRFGLRAVPLNRDKARELVARHWTAATTESMTELDLLPATGFADGTAISWSWYRDRGWLRR